MGNDTWRDRLARIHPVIIALFLMVTIGSILAFLTDYYPSLRNQEATEAVMGYFLLYKTPWLIPYLLFDDIIWTPLYEELKYRSVAFLISFFKPKKVTLEKPLTLIIWILLFICAVIPNIIWSEDHAVPISAHFKSVVFSSLAFYVGRWKGFGYSLLVHACLNAGVITGLLIRIYILHL